MSNDQISILLAVVKRHLGKNKPTTYLIEIVENAIANSEGKTPERYELLKLWRDVTAVKGE